MSSIVTNDTLLGEFLNIQRRRTDWSSPSRTSAAVDEPTNESLWARIVDVLLEWRNHPEQIEDDDLQPISKERLDDALRMAHSMRTAQFLAPLRVIPNTEGGVSFERWQGDEFETVEIDAEGNVEVRYFKGDRLVAQAQWKIPR